MKTTIHTKYLNGYQGGNMNKTVRYERVRVSYFMY